MTHLTTAGYEVLCAKQYIEDDPGYAAARTIAEAAPGLYIFLDNGYQYEGHAPCGCYVSYDERYMHMVGVCLEHSLSMPMAQAM